MALDSAADLASGADVYVTLEPCVHVGRTPPCVDALVAAGVRRVIIGVADPNHEAAGGAQRLREAGVEVQFAADAGAFEELNSGWLHRITTGRPLVTVKVGLSLDAHGCFEPAERASITGTSGAEVTRRLRAGSDAVLVSAVTVIADDPELTVRDADGNLADRQPLRVVLVRNQPPNPRARLFTDEVAPTLILAVGTDPGTCDAIPNSIDRHLCSGSPLKDALAALGERGVGDLLVEPGSRLFSALWSEGLMDRLVTVTAGGMAGAQAPALFVGGPDRIASSLAHRMMPLEAGILGDVSVTVWEPTTGSDEV